MTFLLVCDFLDEEFQSLAELDFFFFFFLMLTELKDLINLHEFSLVSKSFVSYIQIFQERGNHSSCFVLF